MIVELPPVVPAGSDSFRHSDLNAKNVAVTAVPSMMIDIPVMTLIATGNTPEPGPAMGVPPRRRSGWMRPFLGARAFGQIPWRKLTCAMRDAPCRQNRHTDTRGGPQNRRLSPSSLRPRRVTRPSSPQYPESGSMRQHAPRSSCPCRLSDVPTLPTCRLPTCQLCRVAEFPTCQRAGSS